MKILLVPYSIKDLQGLKKWMDKQVFFLRKNQVDSDSVIGIRRKCKITKILGFEPRGARYNTYIGIPIYFNY